ncbi:MAG: alpha/beta hydrolase [Actinomycetota bacterium]|nr:alpha/beta hydrolase [Actinomycetota bacterium]MDH5313567.1 alpha/beta hydrolase [Actinomycetota bacterium]
MTFATEDGLRLEGELRLPDGEPRGSAVLCHPHPKHGGSKDHPILWALRNELAGTRGVAVLAFNFRGVMGSGGIYGGGHGEIHDARAAIERVRDEAPGLPTVVIGWSFGASVALRESLDDHRLAALVLIGMPLRPSDVSLPRLPGTAELRTLALPVLSLSGDNDEYCPPEEARAFVASLPDGRLHIVEDADHYLWRRERDAAAIVGAFVDDVLGG